MALHKSYQNTDLKLPKSFNKVKTKKKTVEQMFIEINAKLDQLIKLDQDVHKQI